jgi:hypothetical protein
MPTEKLPSDAISILLRNIEKVAHEPELRVCCSVYFFVNFFVNCRARLEHTAVSPPRGDQRKVPIPGPESSLGDNALQKRAQTRARAFATHLRTDSHLTTRASETAKDCALAPLRRESSSLRPWKRDPRGKLAQGKNRSKTP